MFKHWGADSIKKCEEEEKKEKRLTTPKKENGTINIPNYKRAAHIPKCSLRYPKASAFCMDVSGAFIFFYYILEEKIFPHTPIIRKKLHLIKF